MRLREIAVTTLAVAGVACGGENRVTDSPRDDTAGLLRDIAIPRLPSPYYHFEYDATGRVSLVSFASGLTRYEVSYAGDRIAELRNTAPGGSTLDYLYDDAGRVATVLYVDADGSTYTRVHLTYNGQRLVGLERERKADGGFVVDKMASFSYHADGNLLEMTEHRPAIAGQQDETTATDRFEQYDAKVNVDGFSLLHTEFFDHLVLLPSVRLQKGNPARVTRTGSGVNYRVDYVYTYDDAGRPLAKNGLATFLNGPDAGETFETSAQYSYY